MRARQGEWEQSKERLLKEVTDTMAADKDALAREQRKMRVQGKEYDAALKKLAQQEAQLVQLKAQLERSKGGTAAAASVASTPAMPAASAPASAA